MWTIVNIDLTKIIICLLGGSWEEVGGWEIWGPVKGKLNPHLKLIRTIKTKFRNIQVSAKGNRRVESISLCEKG